jgi:C4-dicarboxylate-specific signal transduction histidine kinase
LSKASELAAVSELAASIAHEVNQPLAAVIANGHACHRWLAADPPNVERALLSVQRTIRDGNSAAEVVARIRSLFRHAPPSKKLSSLNELIEEVGRVIADDLVSKGVVLRLQLRADLPEASVDRVQLQQVIANLARNGIEAMDSVEGRSKELTIISSMVDGEITVEVRDVGVGLKGDDSFFEPFVTTKTNGMGMGLSICKTILDAHGGRLWSMSNTSHGATFGFALPAVAEHSEDLAAPGKAQSS